MLTQDEQVLRIMKYNVIDFKIFQVCRMGKALGIDSYLPHELSLSLGGCEVPITTF